MPHEENNPGTQGPPAPQNPDVAAWTSATQGWTLDEVAAALVAHSYLPSLPPDQHPPMPPWVATWVIDSVISRPDAYRSNHDGFTFRLELLKALPTLLGGDWLSSGELAARITKLTTAPTPAAISIACTLAEYSALWADAPLDRHAVAAALISLVENHLGETYTVADTIATLWRIADADWPLALQQRLGSLGSKIVLGDPELAQNRVTMSALNEVLSNYSEISTPFSLAVIQPWLPVLRAVLKSQYIHPTALLGLLRADGDNTWADPNLRSCVLAHAGGTSPIRFYSARDPFKLLESVIASWPAAGVRAFTSRMSETPCWQNLSLRREFTAMLVSYEQARVVTALDAEALCMSPIAELRQMGILSVDSPST